VPPADIIHVFPAADNAFSGHFLLFIASLSLIFCERHFVSIFIDFHGFYARWSIFDRINIIFCRFDFCDLLRNCNF